MKRDAPALSEAVEYIEALHDGAKSLVRDARAQLRALLRCARVLRRLRAAGGGWDVDARYEADQALAALDRLNKASGGGH